MGNVVNPTVKLLAKGEMLSAKQMSAKAGDLLPKHTANTESVVLMMEGECVIDLDGTNHILKPGDSIIIPPAVMHQIRAVEDFKAIHVMTNDIKFEFFK
ncbi:MAG: cupin domain-containing protein [Balneolaceae bacterium]